MDYILHGGPLDKHVVSLPNPPPPYLEWPIPCGNTIPIPQYNAHQVCSIPDLLTATYTHFNYPHFEYHYAAAAP